MNLFESVNTKLNETEVSKFSEVNKILDDLKGDYIYSYSDDFNNGSYTITYRVPNVGLTDRAVEVTEDSLEGLIEGFKKSKEELANDFYGCLEGPDDFYGYSSQEELDDRIEIEEGVLEDIINRLLNAQAKEEYKEAETEEVDSTVEIVEDPNFEDPTKGSLTDEERNGLHEFLSDNDWDISFDGDEVFLSQYSPAGEDFGFYVDAHSIDELCHEVEEYADDFDADEHAEMWMESRGKNGVPSSVRELINDADAIQNMLNDLVKLLFDKYQNGSEEIKETEGLKESEITEDESAWITEQVETAMNKVFRKIDDKFKTDMGFDTDYCTKLCEGIEEELEDYISYNRDEDDDYYESEKLKESTKFYNTEEPDCYLTLDKLQVVQNSAGKVLDVATHGLVQNGDTTYVVVSDGDPNTVKVYSVDYGFPYVFKTKGNVNESQKLNESNEDLLYDIKDTLDSNGFETAWFSDRGLLTRNVGIIVSRDGDEVQLSALGLFESEGVGKVALTEDETGYAKYLRDNNVKDLSKYDQDVLQKDDLVKKYMDNPDDDSLFERIMRLNQQTKNVDSSKEKNYNDYLRTVTEETNKELSLGESAEETQYEFNVVITERIGPSQYSSKVVGTYDDPEQANDVAAEYRARGIGATVQPVEKTNNEE